MRIHGRTRLLGVIGQPIGHSLSPQIQNHALIELGEEIVYLPFEIGTEDVGDLVRLFPKIGGLGLNVTTPHKETVGRVTRAGHEEVRQTGVVNTVVYRDGEPLGFCTDGEGLWNWMACERIDPRPQGVTLLGFGSAARSIAWFFGPRVELTIVSRTPSGVRQTLQAWHAAGWKGLPSQITDWTEPVPSGPMPVIAGLPIEVAQSREISGWLSRLAAGSTVIDLNYGAERTAVREEATRLGLSAHDGIGLLVHQAALSLSLWLQREVGASLLAAGLESR